MKDSQTSLLLAIDRIISSKPNVLKDVNCFDSQWMLSLPRN